MIEKKQEVRMKKYNIKEYGAIGDGKRNNAERIQTAIDECFKNGGGTIVFENGVYLTGSIELKDNVILEIKDSATLLGSDKTEDYKEFYLKGFENKSFPRGNGKCLIYAGGCKNVGITGGGNIDGNGDKFVVLRNEAELEKGCKQWKYKRTNKNVSPRMLFFLNCENVHLSNIKISNSPSGWSLFLAHSEHCVCSNLTVWNNLEYENNDGIHLQCCHDVIIDHCDLKCGDDCIIIRTNNKYSETLRKTFKINVTDCKLQSNSSAIRIGWVKDGEVCDCIFNNINICNSFMGITINIPGLFKKSVIPVGSDIGTEYNNIHDIQFQNINIDRTIKAPISIKLTNMPDSKITRLENVLFKNISARSLSFPYLRDKKERICRNIKFENCLFYKERDVDQYPLYASKIKKEKLVLKNVDFMEFFNTRFALSDRSGQTDIKKYIRKK